MSGMLACYDVEMQDCCEDYAECCEEEDYLCCEDSGNVEE